MSIAPCNNHQPMHRFGKGWVCGRCGVPVRPDGRPTSALNIDHEWFERKGKDEGDHEIGVGFEMLPLPAKSGEKP